MIVTESKSKSLLNLVYFENICPGIRLGLTHNLNFTGFSYLCSLCIASCTQPFKRQVHKMVKHTQTNRWLLPTNCVNVFDHFVGLALKGLNCLHYTD